MQHRQAGRENFLVLDRSAGTEPQRVKLLDGVTAVTVRFLGPEIEVSATELDSSNWPDTWGWRRSNAQQLVAPPQAVELRLELEDWGELRRLYELP